MASATLISRATDSPAVELRRLQAMLRQVVHKDQEEPKLAASVCEILDRIEAQLDRVAGLQELFEWYSHMPGSEVTFVLK